LVVLAGGLAGSFFGAAAFFAGAFLAAVLALVVAEVPVTAFLAAPRLDGAVVFLVVVVVLDFGLATVFLMVVGFFTVALGFSVAAFLVGVFFVVEALGLATAAFVVLGFDTGLVAVLGLVADLEVGLFSLVAGSVDLDLGANLTLPEGPFGSTKVPLCSPEAIAFDNWVA